MLQHYLFVANLCVLLVAMLGGGAGWMAPNFLWNFSKSRFKRSSTSSDDSSWWIVGSIRSKFFSKLHSSMMGTVDALLSEHVELCGYRSFITSSNVTCNGGVSGCFSRSFCILSSISVICFARFVMSANDILSWGYLTFAGGEPSLVGRPCSSQYSSVMCGDEELGLAKVVFGEWWEWKCRLDEWCDLSCFLLFSDWQEQLIRLQETQFFFFGASSISSSAGSFVRRDLRSVTGDTFSLVMDVDAVDIDEDEKSVSDEFSELLVSFAADGLFLRRFDCLSASPSELDPGSVLDHVKLSEPSSSSALLAASNSRFGLETIIIMVSNPYCSTHGLLILPCGVVMAIGLAIITIVMIWYLLLFQANTFTVLPYLALITLYHQSNIIYNNNK